MPKILEREQFNATQLSVDYPQQGERVISPQYTLRLSAPEGAKNVEVSIDQGDWRCCRQADGHWWYDWSGYDNGEHEIVARIETQEGGKISSEPHEFFVQL
ncbi:MAG: hypothetical protein HY549_11030 [Elusimicrobia bacterium]|nr:hypothetical protein [Elusimicrobiota bacterium]